MIEKLAGEMEIEISKFFINIEYCGNSGAASLPIALSQAHSRGKLNGVILLVAVGAGFTYGSAIIEI
ncbi:MAG: 3-oxoacyl-[acyl-carrier-protein] synthase III C-terminal domain-containing protein [Bacteroidota bacterium]